MKRFLLLLAIVGLVSCSEALNSDDPDEGGGKDDKEYTVKFKVDMRVPELEEDVINNKDDERAVLYVKFYNDLIANKAAIPNDYVLTFIKDDEIVGEYKGRWGETEIALPNGTYQVTGRCDGDLNHASFSFDKWITIDKNTATLTLSPQFNCWLFLFDRRAFSNAWWCNGEASDGLIHLNKTDDFFYVFNSSSISKLPFVLGSANCNNFHEQIEYPKDNIWHLGLTWQDADKNSPAKVWYYKSPYVSIGWMYLCDKDGHIVSRHLPYREAYNIISYSSFRY